ERLNNLGTIPREDLWKNIAARLPEKESKKRLIPFWYKIAGAAAVVAILAGVGNSMLNPDLVSSPSEFTYNTNDMDIRTRINPVSKYFEDKMNSSVFLLEALIELTDNQTEHAKEVNNIPARIRKSSSSKNNFLADFKAPSENIRLTGYYTFKDFNNAAFTDEQLNKENTLVDVHQKIPPLTGEEKENNNDEAIALSSPNRLSLRPTVGAVYFDVMGSGNIINSQFSTHDSKGEVSMSYGINLAYQLSNKVKIRSGINKVVFSHNTQGIEFAAAVSAITNSAQPLLGTETERDRELSLVSYRMPGELNQHMAFIEIPLEMEYALINKKMGLNVIAGASTLFLNGNMVSLNSPESSGKIGESNNLNELSFSTNIGIGIDYNISPGLQLNLEPIFKYQLNTFNFSSNIQPYNFGIYSGLRYTF